MKEGAGRLEEVEWFRGWLIAEFSDMVDKVATDAGYCAGFRNKGELCRVSCEV